MRDGNREIDFSMRESLTELNLDGLWRLWNKQKDQSDFINIPSPADKEFYGKKSQFYCRREDRTLLIRSAHITFDLVRLKLPAGSLCEFIDCSFSEHLNLTGTQISFKKCIFFNVVGVSGVSACSKVMFDQCIFSQLLEVKECRVSPFFQCFLGKKLHVMGCDSAVIPTTSFQPLIEELVKKIDTLAHKNGLNYRVSSSWNKLNAEFYKSNADFSFPNIDFEKIFIKECIFKSPHRITDTHSVKYQDCTFEDIAIFSVGFKSKILEVSAYFNKDVYFNIEQVSQAILDIKACYFKGNVAFHFGFMKVAIDDRRQVKNFDTFIDEIRISKCVFDNEVFSAFEKVNEKSIHRIASMKINSFKCSNNKFSGVLNLNNLNFGNLDFNFNHCSDIVSFAHCHIEKIAEENFISNSFLSLVNFHQAELPKGFDLSDNLFKEGINFRGVNLTDDPKKHSLNQESCRIIKYSLDKIGNTVEANEYFALEMRNFSHSISLLKNPNKFVIWLSRISSNFGQSWLRPFALLMLTALGYHLGAVLPDIADEYQQTSTLTIQPLFTHNFLEGILPLKKLMGLGSTTYKIELTWANALTTLIQIYLIWQIILASKRQIKR